MLSIAGVAWLLMVCTGCSTTAKPTGAPKAAAEKGPPVLRVGVSETAPPLIFIENEKPTGLEADMARLLAEALGREVRFVSMHFLGLIPELRDGNIDIIMAGMSITEERKRRVAFAEPYLVVGQKAMIRQADQEFLGTTGAIRVTDRRIGVEKGSTGETFARNNLPRAKTFALPTLDEAIRSLVKGEIDVVVYDSTSILWMATKLKDEQLMAVPGLFTTEQLGWAIDKDNTELLDAVNGVLKEWKESGKLDEVITRWLGKSD